MHQASRITQPPEKTRLLFYLATVTISDRYLRLAEQPFSQANNSDLSAQKRTLSYSA